MHGISHCQRTSEPEPRTNHQWNILRLSGGSGCVECFGRIHQLPVEQRSHNFLHFTNNCRHLYRDCYCCRRLYRHRITSGNHQFESGARYHRIVHRMLGKFGNIERTCRYEHLPMEQRSHFVKHQSQYRRKLYRYGHQQQWMYWYSFTSGNHNSKPCACDRWNIRRLPRQQCNPECIFRIRNIPMEQWFNIFNHQSYRFRNLHRNRDRSWRV